MAGTQTGTAAVPADKARLGPAATAGRGIVPLLLGWGVPVAGVVVGGIGGAYLVAWSTGAAARWSAAGVLTMKANMALSLVLAAVALILVEPRRTTPTRRAVGTALAASVTLVGILTLVEHLTRTDFGIDQLLATEPPGAFATAQPNRVGPPGSVSLTLVGLGLLALARQKRVASYFALATGVIVLVPAVGFIAGVVPLYGAAVSGIAWPTVLAFAFLVGGLHLAEGREGPLGLVWRDDPGGRLLRHVVPAAVLVPLALQVLQRRGAQLGLYGHDIGVGVLIVGFIVCMSLLLWRSALHVSAEAARGRGMEAEARESEGKYRLLFRNLLEGFAYCRMLFDARGRPEDFVYLEVNDAFGRLTGLHDVVGKKVTEVIPGIREAHPELLESYGRVARTGTPERFDINLRPLGLWLSISVYRPHPDHFVAVFDDITNRKRVEQELLNANRAKDEFLGMLSHELRNPLAPITLSLYIMEHTDPTGPQARRAREVIGRQVGHLTRLVDDLLEVTRIASGKVQLRRARLDLCELVRRTGEDHRDLLKKRGLEFRSDTPDRAVWVDGDETRLAQVVGNLLHNAAKFTPNGGKVTLSVVGGQGAAELHVIDTGPGIDPALLGRVFDPFVQAEQTLARTEGGLGLGLALVKGLVELHGGSVEARSGGRGLGAEFVVQLPTVPAPEPGREDDRRIRGLNRALRVLVVEDNVDAAEALAELVRMFGHEVEIAHDGPSAIAKATAAAPDLVLCDIGLPGMNGYEVASALRSDPKLQATRLVAVSGYAQPEDVQRAIDAGFIGHIPKPPDHSALEKLLVSS